MRGSVSSDDESVAVVSVSVPVARSLQTPLSATRRALLSNRSLLALRRWRPLCPLDVEGPAQKWDAAIGAPRRDPVDLPTNAA